MCILLEQQLVLILYSSSTPTLVLRAVVVVRLTRTCITLVVRMDTQLVGMHTVQCTRVCILYKRTTRSTLTIDYAYTYAYIMHITLH